MFNLFDPQKKVIVDEGAINELLTRGVAEVAEQKKLEEMLRSGRRLRIKYGIDPTSPDIHIGRATALRKLKIFQELGHTVVLIVGDSTGVIGDTSDKESERPMLSPKEVEQNLKTYFEQMGKIVDLSQAEKHHNSKWLNNLSYKDIGTQADQFSLSDFIDREVIKRRLKAGTRISLREMLYPLMQGYDSVAVRSDIEIGGTDQRFNILAGRTLQSRCGQAPQQMILLELLPGTDGRKMSSSFGNTINITDSPADMYGKTMRLNDSLIPTYFRLATAVPTLEVKAIEEKIETGELHPKEAKMRLAKGIVSLYHGPSVAVEAENDFIKTFVEGGAPEDVKEIFVKEGELLADILVLEKIISSKSEFARLVGEGAIEIVGGEKIKDIKAIALKNTTYKIGKYRFLKTK